MNSLIKRIHSSAPIRICDIGGWTDTWFAGHGAVFNIAVSPCVEIQVSVYPRNPAKPVVLNLANYNKQYIVDPGTPGYGGHPMIEAALEMVDIPGEFSLEIDVYSAAPPGASVGSSAALCVALIGALDSLTPGAVTPAEAASLAHRVETEKLGLQSGIQDQLAAAYGGINFIRMDAYPNSRVTPLEPDPPFLRLLDKRLSLVYIGTPHDSSRIHEKVIADLGDNAAHDPRLQGLRELALQAKESVVERDIEGLAETMNRSVALQEQLHPHLVSHKSREIIALAREFGALGCKVNGAGGDGGSITILGNGDGARKRQMLRELEKRGYPSIPIDLTPQGLTVFED